MADLKQTVIIEKRNKEIGKDRLEILNRMAKRYDGNKERICMDMREILFGLKVGFGGSHIWCCNEKNERIFIVYF